MATGRQRLEATVGQLPTTVPVVASTCNHSTAEPGKRGLRWWRRPHSQGQRQPRDLLRLPFLYQQRTGTQLQHGERSSSSWPPMMCPRWRDAEGSSMAGPSTWLVFSNAKGFKSIYLIVRTHADPKLGFPRGVRSALSPWWLSEMSPTLPLHP